MKSLSVTIQMKATEQYFPVVLFVSNNGFQVSCERKRKRDGWWPFRGKFKTANEKAFCMKGTSPFIISLPGNIWKEWKLHTQH